MDIGKRVKVMELRPGDTVRAHGGSRLVSDTRFQAGDLWRVSFADRHHGFSDEMLVSEEDPLVLVRRPVPDIGRALRAVFETAHSLRWAEPDVTGGEDFGSAESAVNALRVRCEEYLLALPPQEEVS